jgi:hypothetical protein
LTNRPRTIRYGLLAGFAGFALTLTGACGAATLGQPIERTTLAPVTAVAATLPDACAALHSATVAPLLAGATVHSEGGESDVPTAGCIGQSSYEVTDPHAQDFQLSVILHRYPSIASATSRMAHGTPTQPPPGAPIDQLVVRQNTAQPGFLVVARRGNVIVDVQVNDSVPAGATAPEQTRTATGVTIAAAELAGVQFDG